MLVCLSRKESCSSLVLYNSVIVYSYFEKNIKELLEHQGIKTTLGYLHLSSRETLNIKNPLDKLNLGNKKQDNKGNWTIINNNNRCKYTICDIKNTKISVNCNMY